MKTATKPVIVSVADKLPPADLRVIVVGKDYHCLGYIDRDGIWRDDAQHNELHAVIEWI